MRFWVRFGLILLQKTKARLMTFAIFLVISQYMHHSLHDVSLSSFFTWVMRIMTWFHNIRKCKVPQVLHFVIEILNFWIFPMYLSEKNKTNTNGKKLVKHNNVIKK